MNDKAAIAELNIIQKGLHVKLAGIEEALHNGTPLQEADIELLNSVLSNDNPDVITTMAENLLKEGDVAVTDTPAAEQSSNDPSNFTEAQLALQEAISRLDHALNAGKILTPEQYAALQNVIDGDNPKALQDAAANTSSFSYGVEVNTSAEAENYNAGVAMSKKANTPFNSQGDEISDISEFTDFSADAIATTTPEQAADTPPEEKTVEGAVDVSTLDTSSIIYPNEQGMHVKQLQTVLAELEYYDGPIDGQYGKETALAIAQLQADNGKTPDGIAGPATMNEIPAFSTIVANAKADSVMSEASHEKFNANEAADGPSSSVAHRNSDIPGKPDGIIK